MRQNQQEQSCKTASILGKQSYLRNAEDILVYWTATLALRWLERKKKMVAEKIQNENGG